MDAPGVTAQHHGRPGAMETEQHLEEADLRQAIAGLSSKMASLDLTDGERTVLAAVLARAAEDGDEVEGFINWQGPSEFKGSDEELQAVFSRILPTMPAIGGWGEGGKG